MSDTAATEVKPAEEPKWAKELSNSLKEMGTGISALVTMAQKSQDQPRPNGQAPTEVEEVASLLDDNNLELMPRKQLVAKIEENFTERLEAALKPITDQITQTQASTLASDYKQDAIRFADAIGPERFAEWQTEMMAIAEKSPSLSVPDIYLLALAKNPAKAQTVEAKYKKTASPPEPAPKPPARKPPLSITPTSPPSGDVKNQRMSQDEAAQQAWDDSVAKFGNPFE